MHPHQTGILRVKTGFIIICVWPNSVTQGLAKKMVKDRREGRREEGEQQHQMISRGGWAHLAARCCLPTSGNTEADVSVSPPPAPLTSWHTLQVPGHTASDYWLGNKISPYLLMEFIVRVQPGKIHLSRCFKTRYFPALGLHLSSPWDKV